MLEKWVSLAALKGEVWVIFVKLLFSTVQALFSKMVHSLNLKGQ